MLKIVEKLSGLYGSATICGFNKALKQNQAVVKWST